jgi:thioredoxin 1
MAVAGGDVMNIGDGDFGKEVLESDQPVLVDFWATWCAPCRAIAPAVEDLAKEYKGRVKFAKLNIDDNQDTPQQYGIRSIPTLLVFKGGSVVGQIVGAVPKARIEDAIKKAL